MTKNAKTFIELGQTYSNARPGSYTREIAAAQIRQLAPQLTTADVAAIVRGSCDQLTAREG